MRNAGGDTQPPRPREQWTSNAGFVVATIGSAVGLGNIWRFAYVAGENGGAAFLLVYLVLVLLVGLPLMMAEFVIGRRGAGDAVTAFETPRRAARCGLSAGSVWSARS